MVYAVIDTNILANYATRHPSCLQSPQTAIPASNMHRASIPSASSKQQTSWIVCPCGSSRTKNRSSAAGVDLWWSANHRMKWFRATRRSGFLFFPEGRRPRWEVDPPLRVREDWWVFERPFFNGKKRCQWAQWKFTFKLPNAASFIKKRRTGWF